jgi:hypothetical protein
MRFAHCAPMTMLLVRGLSRVSNIALTSSGPLFLTSAVPFTENGERVYVWTKRQKRNATKAAPRSPSARGGSWGRRLSLGEKSPAGLAVSFFTILLTTISFRRA